MKIPIIFSLNVPWKRLTGSSPLSNLTFTLNKGLLLKKGIPPFDIELAPHRRPGILLEIDSISGVYFLYVE